MDSFEIDLTKKYLLVIPEQIDLQTRKYILDEISHWLQSDDPICILPINARLIKVEQPEIKIEIDDSQE